jgi:hypothetical protein
VKLVGINLCHEEFGFSETLKARVRPLKSIEHTKIIDASYSGASCTPSSSDDLGYLAAHSHGELLLARLNSLLSNICTVRDQIAYSPDRNRAIERIVDVDLYISRTISRVSLQL